MIMTRGFLRTARPASGACLALCAMLPVVASAQADLSVVAIARPVSGCALAGTENVGIRLFNYGAALTAGTSFDVSYTINAGAPVTELIVLASTLLPDSTYDYTFVTQADLSVPGAYAFDATVSIPGDINPANDAFTGYEVVNTAPSDGGTLTGPASPATSGTLTLSGATGDVVQWEESEDGGQRWFALANTTTTQDFADLRTPTEFRVRVRNGACADAVSNGVSVTP
jgi:hypothetical protein